MTGPVRIATRKSALALWQANHVKGLLEQLHPGLAVSLVPIVTRGDRIVDRPLATIGGKGLFLKELEQAMLEGRADMAVHSMKDMPAEMADGLVVETVLERANPMDALVSRNGESLESLAPGAVVGTSSLRRQCQLLHARPDLVVSDLRGNVDTRLRKLDEGQFDAIILACAGLERLGWGDRITQELSAPAWLPASTQGIIGIQTREGDTGISRLLAPLNHEPSHLRSRAERRVALRLGAGCQLPVAVFSGEGDTMVLSALVGMPDGTRVVRAEAEGARNRPEQLGDAVAERLLELGAGEIIEFCG